MMKHITAIIILLFVVACEDVIDVNLPAAPPRLVIDASLEKQFTTTRNLIRDKAIVNLSLTTPFFEEDDSFVNDALVNIADTENNRVFELINIGLGNYQIFDNSFTIQENVIYKLTVVYNDEVYESEASLSLGSPFNSVCQVVNNNQFSDGVAVEIAFNDLPNEQNFYFLDLGDGNFTTIDDDFFIDGEEIKFTYFFDENVTLDHLFKLKGSTKRFNTFTDALLELSGGDTNGPFATVPFQARGNIINITNSENFPFGFFNISEAYSLRVQLVENANFEDNK